MTWIRVDDHWPDVSDDIRAESPYLHDAIKRAMRYTDGLIPVYVHETRLTCLDDLPHVESVGAGEIVR